LIVTDDDGATDYDSVIIQVVEEGSIGGKWDCFIATAAYGTPMAEEIQVLRDFRDQYLVTNPVGEALVHLYYNTSPPIADFIDKHPVLKQVRAKSRPCDYIYISRKPQPCLFRLNRMGRELHSKRNRLITSSRISSPSPGFCDGNIWPFIEYFINSCANNQFVINYKQYCEQIVDLCKKRIDQNQFTIYRHKKVISVPLYKKIKDKIVAYNYGVYYGLSESQAYGIGDNNPLGYAIAPIRDRTVTLHVFTPYPEKIFK
jgi:hypothetical protein